MNWSKQKRIKFFVTGCVLPFTCFVFSMIGGLRKVGIMSSEVFWHFLGPEVLAGFMPLILYSMVSLGAICYSPCYVEKVWARLGVYTGVVLCIQYLIFLGPILLVGAPIFLFVSALVSGAIAIGTEVVMQFAPRSWQFRISQLLTVTAIVALLLTLFVRLRIWESAYLKFFLLASYFLALSATPVVTSITFLRAGSNSKTHASGEHRKIVDLRHWLLWSAFWVAGWSFAIYHVYHELTILPEVL
jgi:hypothetical protein